MTHMVVFAGDNVMDLIEAIERKTPADRTEEEAKIVAYAKAHGFRRYSILKKRTPSIWTSVGG